MLAHTACWLTASEPTDTYRKTRGVLVGSYPAQVDDGGDPHRSKFGWAGPILQAKTEYARGYKRASPCAETTWRCHGVHAIGI